jgi:hypothetical protein
MATQCCSSRGTTESPSQQPHSDCDLHQRDAHSEAVKGIGRERKHLGNRPDHPRKIDVDEIQIQLLQAGQNVGAGDGESGDVQRPLPAAGIVTLPGEQRERRQQNAVLKNPRLPPRLVEQAKHADDRQQGCDQSPGLRRDQYRRREHEDGGKQAIGDKAIDGGQQGENRNCRVGPGADPQMRGHRQSNAERQYDGSLQPKYPSCRTRDKTAIGRDQTIHRFERGADEPHASRRQCLMLLKKRTQGRSEIREISDRYTRPHFADRSACRQIVPWVVSNLNPSLEISRRTEAKAVLVRRSPSDLGILPTDRVAFGYAAKYRRPRYAQPQSETALLRPPGPS